MPTAAVPTGTATFFSAPPMPPPMRFAALWLDDDDDVGVDRCVL
jgi:hypothetical protein